MIIQQRAKEESGPLDFNLSFLVDEIVVLVTASSHEEAASLGRIVVEKKLAACVNVIPNVSSIFQWDGKVTQEQECLMILKSRMGIFDNLEATVKANHSYEVPEIIALPVVKGSPEYLEWIQEMTQGSRNL